MVFFVHTALWSLLLLPIYAQAGPSVGEQLEVQGYKPASCQASPPSTYKVGDTSVPLTIVNDLPVKLQPAYLDLAGIVKLLPKREASSSWQDSTYKGTIWLWLDDTNKTCLGMSLIQDVKYQPSTIRISDLSLHQSATVEPPPDSSEPTSQEDAKVEGNSIQAKERAALAAFYGVTDGGGWSKNSGWLTEENHCDWYGVDCENGRVTGINLRYNRVTGEIPALVGEFTRLKTLNLEGNKLQGSIPAELTNLRELRTLDLSANKLSGSLPVTFSRLTKLRKLDLNGSSLSGRLAAVGSMSLYYLDVRGNDFTEQLSALGKQTGMRYFYISDNNFMGEIPEWLENWKYLYYFDISNNRLSGSFPRGVAERLAKVRSAKIGGNDFRCPIPFILRDTLANSGEFCIGFEVGNTYSGELEAYYDYKSKTDFGHIAFKSRFKDGMRDGLHQRWHPDGTLMHQAEYKEGKKNGIWKSWDDKGKQWEGKNYVDGKLHGTYLTFNKGAVSKEYCYRQGKRIYSRPCAPDFEDPPSKDEIRDKERQALVALYASTNGRDWKKSDGWLSDTDHCAWFGVVCDGAIVKQLNLSRNNLSGYLPQEISGLSALEKLMLNFNNLSGVLPSQLGSLLDLETLYLNNNRFSGRIPDSMSRLTKLKSLIFGNNMLSGEIPSWVANMTSLSHLTFNNNNFSGELPSELRALTRMRYFYADKNELTGKFPAWITEWEHLIRFNIEDNLLTGEISVLAADKIAATSHVTFHGNNFSCPIHVTALYALATHREFCLGEKKGTSYDGLLEGRYSKKDTTRQAVDHGNIAFSGYFKNGKEEGLHQRWFPNGQLMRQVEYSAGKKHGAFRTWDKAGQINSEKNFHNGKLHGVSQNFVGGKVSKESCYQFGKVVDESECLSQATSVNATVTYTPERKKERDALIALYNSTNGPSWLRREGWLSEADYCSWDGIRCVDGRVRNLSLSKNNLSGTLPEEIGNLTKIFSLNLSGQKLTGRIPESIERISSGTNIDLSGNGFKCPFPQIIRGDLAYYGNEFCEQDKRVDDFSGVLEGFYSNGNKRFIGMFSNGEIDGPFRAWFRDGQPWVVYHYKDGSKHGVQRIWASNGQPVSEVSYREGSLDGFYLRYQNGKIAGKSCYVLNKKVEGLACIQEDTDLDGVANHEDKCPKTPSIATSDTTGCSQHQLDKSLVTTGTKSSKNNRDIEDRHSTASTLEKNAVVELNPVPIRTPSANRQAPNSGEKLALVVHELNSAKRMYNDQYELKEVRMDYDNRELNYIFSVRDSLSELDVSMLAMVAESTYCSASKLELFREENIPAVWIYADSSGEELRIPTWPVDCK